MKLKLTFLVPFENSADVVEIQPFILTVDAKQAPCVNNYATLIILNQATSWFVISDEPLNYPRCASASIAIVFSEKNRVRAEQILNGL